MIRAIHLSNIRGIIDKMIPGGLKNASHFAAIHSRVHTGCLFYPLHSLDRGANNSKKIFDTSFRKNLKNLKKNLKNLKNLKKSLKNPKNLRKIL